jgi:hypothetical protein
MRYSAWRMQSIDVHQHLWPEAVLKVLEKRATAPKAHWQAENHRWRVDLPTEPSFEIDPADHDPEVRAGGLGVDRALVALSSPVGAEALPPRDALAVIAAWNEAAGSLPAALGWWSATPAALTGQDEADIAREAISAGAAGVCLPATRLQTPTEAEHALPVLEAVADAGAPVFVHPGEAGGRRTDPAWWAPAIDYVAQMHAAWHSFHAGVRHELKELRVIFALLAGLAPLQAERTQNRGGARETDPLADQLSFYDTSSYGPRAARAMATAVGIGQLVNGSDYPVAREAAEPVKDAFGEGFANLVKRDGPARALGHTWVPA